MSWIEWHVLFINKVNRLHYFTVIKYWKQSSGEIDLKRLNSIGKIIDGTSGSSGQETYGGERKRRKEMNKAISSILSAAAGVVVGAGVTQRAKQKEISKAWGYSDKHLTLYQMMNQWVQVKQEGKNLASYFEANGYRKIAVYGMSFAGETLLRELKGTAVEAVYGIDQNAEGINADVDIYTLKDDLPSVDAVVVTAITFFDEIEEKLADKVSCPILSLEDILYEV